MLKKIVSFLVLTILFAGCSMDMGENEEDFSTFVQEESTSTLEDSSIPLSKNSTKWVTYVAPVEYVTVPSSTAGIYLEAIKNGSRSYNYYDGVYGGSIKSVDFRVTGAPNSSSGYTTFPLEITYAGTVSKVFANEIGRYYFSGNLADQLIMGPGTQYGRSYEYETGIGCNYEIGKNYALSLHNKGTGSFYVNDYVQLPNTKVSNEFTISLWTLFRDNSNSTYEAAIISFGRCRLEDSFAVFVKPNGDASAVIASEFGGSKLYWYATPGKNIQDNRWHHIAATYKNRTLSFYVDGRLIGTRQLSYYHNPNFYNLRQFLGLHEWSTGMYRRSCFNGRIDLLRVSTTALSASDISKIYTGENPYN